MKKQESYRRFTTEEIMQCKTNPQMLNELVKNCQGLVYKIARSITMDFTYEQDDKIQIGYSALIKAVKTYNPDSNTDFYTYCHTCVRNGLLQEAHKSKAFANGGYGQKFDYSSLDENDSYKAIKTVSINKIAESENNNIDGILCDERMSSNLHDIYVQRNEEWDFLKDLNLKPQHIDVFIQYYLDGKSQVEIAQLRGVSKQAINNTIVTIEKKIREKYTYEELVNKLF